MQNETVCFILNIHFLM